MNGYFSQLGEVYGYGEQQEHMLLVARNYTTRTATRGIVATIATPMMLWQ